ncbi:MAG: Peptidoglycan N-acetylglucosamine deacetylase, partial [Oscillospiraceae bacterium]|nr:Peptidoglycan N-acetylglucosamine deacetylase [Oscillospiraceae bacterium]
MKDRKKIRFLGIMMCAVFVVMMFASCKKYIDTKETMGNAQSSSSGKGISSNTKSESSKTLEQVYVERHASQNPKNKKVAYLTFDDGPTALTPKILDILKQKGVKATFFVIHHESEETAKYYKRIVKEGHQLAIHSYSHDYEKVYKNMDAFFADYKKIQDYVYKITGVKV